MVFTCETEKSACDCVCLFLQNCINKLDIAVGARPLVTLYISVQAVEYSHIFTYTPRSSKPKNQCKVVKKLVLFHQSLLRQTYNLLKTNEMGSNLFKKMLVRKHTPL